MKFYSLLLFCLPLAATVNEPLRVEVFSGYRNDRIHWHLQQGGEGTLFYSEIYRDVEFWENGLMLKAIHRDLSFFLKGSYGTFGRGTIFQRYANQSFAIDQPKFQGTRAAGPPMAPVILATQPTLLQTEPINSL